MPTLSHHVYKSAWQSKNAVCANCTAFAVFGLTSVYIKPGRLLIGQFGSSGIESAPLKVNIKIFELLEQLFNSWSNHVLSEFDHYTLLCFESESYSDNCPFIAEKLDLEYLLCQIQWGFSDALPFYSIDSWVNPLSGSAAGDFRPSE